MNRATEKCVTLCVYILQTWSLCFLRVCFQRNPRAFQMVLRGSIPLIAPRLAWETVVQGNWRPILPYIQGNNPEKVSQIFNWCLLEGMWCLMTRGRDIQRFSRLELPLVIGPGFSKSSVIESSPKCPMIMTSFSPNITHPSTCSAWTLVFGCATWGLQDLSSPTRTQTPAHISKTTKS